MSEIPSAPVYGPKGKFWFVVYGKGKNTKTQKRICDERAFYINQKIKQYGLNSQSGVTVVNRYGVASIEDKDGRRLFAITEDDVSGSGNFDHVEVAMWYVQKIRLETFAPPLLDGDRARIIDQFMTFAQPLVKAIAKETMECLNGSKQIEPHNNNFQRYETDFFRYPKQLNWIVEALRQKAKKAKPNEKVYLLDIGCSFGEEPISIILAVLEDYENHPDKWGSFNPRSQFRVIATDIDLDGAEQHYAAKQILDLTEKFITCVSGKERTLITFLGRANRIGSLSQEYLCLFEKK